MQKCPDIETVQFFLLDIESPKFFLLDTKTVHFYWILKVKFLLDIKTVQFFLLDIKSPALFTGLNIQVDWILSSYHLSKTECETFLRDIAVEKDDNSKCACYTQKLRRCPFCTFNNFIYVQ